MGGGSNKTVVIILYFNIFTRLLLRISNSHESEHKNDNTQDRTIEAISLQTEN